MAGTGQINSEILHKLPKYLEEMGKNSVLSRIKGFFTFVNLIWMIAILGIIISIGPSLIYLLYPFQEILKKLFDKIIKPLILFLYNFGFFEFLGYYISIIFIVDGMKVNKEWGFFISLTGTGFLVLLFFYSIKKYLNFDDIDFDLSEINDIEHILLGILITMNLFSLSII